MIFDNLRKAVRHFLPLFSCDFVTFLGLLSEVAAREITNFSFITDVRLYDTLSINTSAHEISTSRS